MHQVNREVAEVGMPDCRARIAGYICSLVDGVLYRAARGKECQLGVLDRNDPIVVLLEIESA
jgi:hypothetical protein